MAYQKTYTSRAKSIIPSDTNNIEDPFSVAASGTGASVFTLGGGEIGSVTLLPANVGSGYLTAPNVTITDGSGSGAVLSASIDAQGSVSSINIISLGSGYVGPFTVVISGGTFKQAQPCVLYLGAGGAGKDITVTTEAGDKIKFSGALAGTILGGPCAINVTKVWATGTSVDYVTTGNLIGLW